MSLPESPLHVFSRSVQEHGQVRVELGMPWPLPWTVGALRAALAWEVAACCERWRQLAPHHTSQALDAYIRREFVDDDFQWLDGAFSKNSRRILNSIAEDLSRVQPRPVIVIAGPITYEEDHEALNELGQLLGTVIRYEHKYLSEKASAETKAAIRLLGSAGIANTSLGQMLVGAAHEAGDVELAASLSEAIGGSWDGTQVFSAYEVLMDDERLTPVFRALRRVTWPSDLPDWQSLELPSLLRELWIDPWRRLDQIRADSTRHLKVARNAFHIRISIARHYLRCFVGEGLAARLDLIEASVHLWNRLPERAWRLLAPHIDAITTSDNAILAAHIYGQAGQAVSKLGRPEAALEFYERNLACLEPAFGVDSPAYMKARAGLEHKIGQLIREHPDFPGGLARARQHIEASLQLHESLGLARGISMCLSEMGELSASEGSFDEAVIWFERALEADRQARNVDGEARVLHQLAVMYEHAGEFEKALLYIEQCEQVQQAAGVSNALRQQVLNTRERIQHLLGVDNHVALDDFLDTLNTSLDEDPRTFTTRVTQRARILREHGRFSDAEMLLQEALKRSVPETHKQFLLIALVSLLLDLQRYEEVRKVIQDISPSDTALSTELALSVARLEYQTGNYEQAEDIIANISVDSNPELMSRVYMLRGRARLNQGRFEEAATNFRASREGSQTSPYVAGVAMELEARSYLAGGQYHEAAELAHQLAGAAAARQWRLRHIRALVMLGDALMGLGRISDAAQEFERAIELSQGVEEGTPFSRVALERRAARAWFSAGNGNMALLRIRNAIELLDHEDAPLDQRGWIYHMAATIYRSNGNYLEHEAALNIAQQCANDADSEQLRHAIVILRQGDLRHDQWQEEDLDASEAELPQAVIGRARRLRIRRKLNEALEALATIEHTPVREPVQREMLELKIGILLDMKDMGHETDVSELLEQLAMGKPDKELSPKLLLLKSRAGLLSGRYQAAIDATRIAYDKAAAYGEFFSIARAGAILSRALTEKGRQQEAISTLLKIAEYMRAHGRHQFAFDATYSACRNLIDMRSFDEAHEHLKALDDASGQLSLADWVRLQIAYATIERIENLSEAAVARMDNVLERVVAEGRPDLRVDADRLRQAALLDSGLIREATQFPHSERGRFNVVKSASASVKELRLSGRHKEAIVVAEQELERLGPDESRLRAIALHNAAQAYNEMRILDKAESYCRQALDMHTKLGMRSGIPGVRVTLGRILSKAERLEEAREQALVALAENKEARDNRGVQICERFLAHLSGEELSSGRREYARDMLNRALALRRTGKTFEAHQVLAEALRHARLEQDEITEAKALGALGITSFNAGDFNQAVENLVKAVELHSRNKSAYMGECSSYLARSYSELGKHEEAHQVMLEAVRFARLENDESSEAKALGALGIMDFHGGDFAAAAESLEKAVELHSRLGSDQVGKCSSYLARSYSAIGKHEEARQVIGRALDGNLKPEERVKLKQLLARLAGRP